MWLFSKANSVHYLSNIFFWKTYVVEAYEIVTFVGQN